MTLCRYTVTATLDGTTEATSEAVAEGDALEEFWDSLGSYTLIVSVEAEEVKP